MSLGFFDSVKDWASKKLASTEFVTYVDQATAETLLQPNYEMYMVLVDAANDPKGEWVSDVVRSVRVRMDNPNPKVKLFTLELISVLVQNCGLKFHSELNDAKGLLNSIVEVACLRQDLVRGPLAEARKTAIQLVVNLDYWFKNHPAKEKTCNLANLVQDARSRNTIFENVLPDTTTTIITEKYPKRTSATETQRSGQEIMHAGVPATVSASSTQPPKSQVKAKKKAPSFIFTSPSPTLLLTSPSVQNNSNNTVANSTKGIFSISTSPPVFGPSTTSSSSRFAGGQPNTARRQALPDPLQSLKHGQKNTGGYVEGAELVDVEAETELHSPKEGPDPAPSSSQQAQAQAQQPKTNANNNNAPRTASDVGEEQDFELQEGQQPNTAQTFPDFLMTHLKNLKLGRNNDNNSFNWNERIFHLSSCGVKYQDPLLQQSLEVMNEEASNAIHHVQLHDQTQKIIDDCYRHHFDGKRKKEFKFIFNVLYEGEEQQEQVQVQFDSGKRPRQLKHRRLEEAKRARKSEQLQQQFQTDLERLQKEESSKKSSRLKFIFFRNSLKKRRSVTQKLMLLYESADELLSEGSWKLSWKLSQYYRLRSKHFDTCENLSSRIDLLCEERKFQEQFLENLEIVTSSPSIDSPDLDSSSIVSSDDIVSCDENSSDGDVLSPSSSSSSSSSSSPSPMQIFIRSSDGEKIITTTLGDVKTSDSIIQIKNKIQQKTGFPCKQQRLTFSGRNLEDANTLGDYNVQNSSTFYLDVVVVGGATPITQKTPLNQKNINNNKQQEQKKKQQLLLTQKKEKAQKLKQQLLLEQAKVAAEATKNSAAAAASSSDVGEGKIAGRMRSNGKFIASNNKQQQQVEKKQQQQEPKKEVDKRTKSISFISPHHLSFILKKWRTRGENLKNYAPWDEQFLHTLTESPQLKPSVKNYASRASFCGAIRGAFNQLRDKEKKNKKKRKAEKKGADAEIEPTQLTLTYEDSIKIRGEFFQIVCLNKKNKVVTLSSDVSSEDGSLRGKELMFKIDVPARPSISNLDLNKMNTHERWLHERCLKITDTEHYNAQFKVLVQKSWFRYNLEHGTRGELHAQNFLQAKVREALHSGTLGSKHVWVGKGAGATTNNSSRPWTCSGGKSGNGLPGRMMAGCLDKSTTNKTKNNSGGEAKVAAAGGGGGKVAANTGGGGGKVAAGGGGGGKVAANTGGGGGKVAANTGGGGGKVAAGGGGGGKVAAGGGGGGKVAANTGGGGGKVAANTGGGGGKVAAGGGGSGKVAAKKTTKVKMTPLDILLKNEGTILLTQQFVSANGGDLAKWFVSGIVAHMEIHQQSLVVSSPPDANITANSNMLYYVMVKRDKNNNNPVVPREFSNMKGEKLTMDTFQTLAKDPILDPTSSATSGQQQQQQNFVDLTSSSSSQNESSTSSTQQQQNQFVDSSSSSQNQHQQQKDFFNFAISSHYSRAQIEQEQQTKHETLVAQTKQLETLTDGAKKIRLANLLKKKPQTPEAKLNAQTNEIVKKMEQAAGVTEMKELMKVVDGFGATRTFARNMISEFRKFRGTRKFKMWKIGITNGAGGYQGNGIGGSREGGCIDRAAWSADGHRPGLGAWNSGLWDRMRNDTNKMETPKDKDKAIRKKYNYRDKCTLDPVETRSEMNILLRVRVRTVEEYNSAVELLVNLESASQNLLAGEICSHQSKLHCYGFPLTMTKDELEPNEPNKTKDDDDQCDTNRAVSGDFNMLGRIGDGVGGVVFTLYGLSRPTVAGEDGYGDEDEDRPIDTIIGGENALGGEENAYVDVDEDSAITDEEEEEEQQQEDEDDSDIDFDSDEEDDSDSDSDEEDDSDSDIYDDSDYVSDSDYDDDDYDDSDYDDDDSDYDDDNSDSDSDIYEVIVVRDSVDSSSSSSSNAFGKQQQKRSSLPSKITKKQRAE